MNRSLAIALLCVALTACNGSGDTPAANTPTPPGSTGNTGNNPGAGPDTGANPAAFEPTAMTLDSPPIDGKLPAELMPPV